MANKRNELSPVWKTIEYSKKQIEQAGKILGDPNSTDTELRDATKVVDNWRESHGYPLHVIYINLRRYAEDNDSIIVAERMKRLDSITKKLKRFSNMSLWRMQDLGGCRMIVNTVDEVYFFANKYENSSKRHILRNSKDYIKEPKEDGYRSLHRVYQYHSDKKDTYNRNMLIEIQFRTHLQHIWATAVETIGLSGKAELKFGQGEEDLKRFFALVSSLFAIREKMPTVPNTPNNTKELVAEIKELNEQHNYLEMLQGLSLIDDSVVFFNSPIDKKNGYFILIFNYEKRSVRVQYFKANDTETANKTYASIEKSRNEDKVDAVLVRVSSFNSLKAAYPNYFSDVYEFVQLVNLYLNAN